MTFQSHPAAAAVSAFVLLVSLQAATAQTPVTASNVLANVGREFDKVNDYTVDLSAVIDMPGMKVPPMKARMWYARPDRMHLETDGFAMLPRDAVALNPRIFSEDLYDAVLQGEESINGTRCLKLKLLARSDTLRLQRVMLFVDPTRWIILKMNTDPSQGGSAEISITYAYVDNKYFMPSKVLLRMQTPEGAGRGMMRKKFPPKGEGAADKANQPSTVTLSYTNYRVNKGIADEVFMRDKEKNK